MRDECRRNPQVDRPVGDYTKSRGLPTAAAVELQRQRFGSNSLHIPIPKFQDIFGKQMLGPVPVFQVRPPFKAPSLLGFHRPR